MGVTTVVIGNCGIGFAPCRPQDRKALIKLMEGVETFPAPSPKGLTWTGRASGLSRGGGARTRYRHGVLVPHSPIRVYAMGERCLAPRAGERRGPSHNAPTHSRRVDAGASASVHPIGGSSVFER